jgi:hypothetical protein
MVRAGDIAASNMTLRYLALLAILLGLGSPGWAGDFGDPKDVKQVKTVVKAQFHHALNASVSHDWALCTASWREDDVSVVLERVGAGWKVVAHDGGAYGKDTLKEAGVPETDVGALLRAYQ